jgi:hypothetical protein
VPRVVAPHPDDLPADLREPSHPHLVGMGQDKLVRARLAFGRIILKGNFI